MLTNWATKKTIITLVIIAIILFILHELKLLGNTTTVLNIRRFDVGGGVGGGIGGGVQLRPGSALVYGSPYTKIPVTRKSVCQGADGGGLTTLSCDCNTYVEITLPNGAKKNVKCSDHFCLPNTCTSN